MCFVDTVGFFSGRESTKAGREAGQTLHDENIARVVAVLKEHRSASCRLVQELTGVPRIIVQRIVKNGL